MSETIDYMSKTIKQIEDRDSKSDRWDMAHYLGVARICNCKNCYCCAVKQWANQRAKQGGAQ